ncbi:MAG: acylneuraminate cytidylyltransferase family protein [Thermodesulfobacteriota bacterium]
MSQDATVCIILARAGSKRLPGKNTHLLLGRPLYAWAVDAALEAGCFSHVVFSTDDEEILRGLTAWPQVLAVPRPPELAGDDVVGWRVCQHLMADLPSVFRTADAFCLLTPCHPFRTGRHVREAMEHMGQANADAMITTSRFPFPPGFTLDERDGWLTPTWQGLVRKGQHTPKIHPNGAALAVRLEAFARHGHVYTERTIGHHLPWPWALDIDEAEDFAMAELLAPCILGGGR